MTYLYINYHQLHNFEILNCDLLHLVLNAAKSVAASLKLDHALEDEGHEILSLLFISCLLLSGICVCNAFFQKLIQLSIIKDIG